MEKKQKKIECLPLPKKKIECLPLPKGEDHNKWVVLREMVRARKIKYLSGLEKTGTVTGGMRFANITSYATIGNWRKSDSEFLEQEYRTVTEKTSEIIDVAESRLFLAVQAGDLSAVKYILDRLSKKYKPKADIETKEVKEIKAIELILCNPDGEREKITTKSYPSI